MNVSDLGEDPLIQRITAGLPQQANVIVGPGDDCAVIERNHTHDSLLKTDCIVEHVHFLPDTEAERIGWKAVARVVSDFAAMGGLPESLLITLVIPPETETSWVESLYSGMQCCAEFYDFSIVGGETSSTTSGSPAMISIAGTGLVEKGQAILRSTAQDGDLIFVTGKLGGSIQGKHLDFHPRIEQARWLAEHFRPSAMMDLSDGVAKDLPRLAQASKLGFQLDTAKLPCSDGSTTENALNDGEDFELLFTLSAEHAEHLATIWHQHYPDIPLTCVGCMTRDESQELHGGWDHFKQA